MVTLTAQLPTLDCEEVAQADERTLALTRWVVAVIFGGDCAMTAVGRVKFGKWFVRWLCIMQNIKADESSLPFAGLVRYDIEYKVILSSWWMVYLFFFSVETLFLYGGLVRIQWECIRNDFIAVVWFLSSTLLWK